jgi:hypothetical protein
MKTLKIIPIVLIIAAGCSEQNAVVSNDKPKVQRQSENGKSVKGLQSTPTGRWLANNLHCQNQIDIRNSYEITITDEGVNNASFSTSGWINIDSGSYVNKINGVVDNLRGCLEFDTKSLQISNVMQEKEVFTIAFDKTKSVVLRIYENNDVSVLVPFSVDLLKSYTLVDSLSGEPPAYDPYTDE